MQKQTKYFIKQTGQCNLAIFLCSWEYSLIMRRYFTNFFYQIFDIRTDLRILDIKQSWILCAVCT